MAKVTWNGEDGSPVESTTIKGHVFKKGEAVDIDDDALVAKLQGNKFFEVTGAKPAPKPDVVVPPSKQSALGPVEKPGEPRDLAKGPTNEPKK